MYHQEVVRYWNENAEVWTRLARAGCDVYRDQLNTPAFFAMLPDVTSAGRTARFPSGSPTFEKSAMSLLSEAEILEMELQLAVQPDAGDLIPSGRGLRSCAVLRKDGANAEVLVSSSTMQPPNT